MRLSYNVFICDFAIWFVGVTLSVRQWGRYSGGFINCLNCFENAQLAVIRSVIVTQNSSNHMKEKTKNTKSSQLIYRTGIYSTQVWDKHEYHDKGTSVTRHRCDWITKKGHKTSKHITKETRSTIVHSCHRNKKQLLSTHVKRSIELAVLHGFTYIGSVRKFNLDPGFWPLYRRWALLRGDRYEGFHCSFRP